MKADPFYFFYLEETSELEILIDIYLSDEYTSKDSGLQRVEVFYNNSLEANETLEGLYNAEIRYRQFLGLGVHIVDLIAFDHLGNSFATEIYIEIFENPENSTTGDTGGEETSKNEDPNGNATPTLELPVSFLPIILGIVCIAVFTRRKNHI